MSSTIEIIASRGGIRRGRGGAPLFVHLPWSKSRGASRSLLDAEDLAFMATIQRATGRILALHFTLTPAGVRRLAKYYPILPMDRLEEQFIETFQGIPISLSRGQLTRLAGQIGFRGRRPGFLLPPPRDVYAGLPEEFHPSGDDVEPELAPGEHSPLDPLPIFPTSEEVRLMTELLRVSNGHVLVGESPERGHGGDL